MRAITRRVEKLVGMPRHGQRPGLRLAVADHAAGEQFRIVEYCAIGMRQGVTELAAFVDRSRCLGGDVAADAAGEGKLAEQAFHALGIECDTGIELAVAAFARR